MNKFLFFLLLLILISSFLYCSTGQSLPLPPVHIIDEDTSLQKREDLYLEYNIDRVSMYEDTSLPYFKIGNFNYLDGDLVELFELAGGEADDYFTAGRSKLISGYTLAPTGAATILSGIMFYRELDDYWGGWKYTFIGFGTGFILASIGLIVWSVFDYENAAEAYNQWLKGTLGIANDTISIDIESTYDENETEVEASIDIRF